MSFQVSCPHCGSPCDVSKDDVGRTALCGNCDEPIIVSRNPGPVTSATSPQPGDAAPVRPNHQSHSVNDTAERALPRLPDKSGMSRRSWGCIVATTAVFVAVFVVGIWFYQSIQRANDRVHRSKNLKILGLSLHNYHEVYGALPPAYVADENGKPMHSWRVLLLPFIEQQELYDRYNFDEPWDGPNNRKLWDEMPSCYAWPVEDFDEPWLTPYQVAVGSGTPFEHGRRISLSDITDGTSNTILVFEVPSKPVNWMKPIYISYDSDKPLPASIRSSKHDTIIMAGRADGSTLRFEPDISDEMLRRLTERSDCATASQE